MNNWLLYCLAVVLVVFSPGPMTLFALTNAMSYGKHVAVRGILGGSLAYVGHLLIAYLVMHNTANMDPSNLKVVRFLGGAYFLWLAYKQFSKNSFVNRQKNNKSIKDSAGFVEAKGFMIAATNPKAILFFAALFPQFIDTSRDYASQFIALGITYLVIQFASNFSYGWFGERLMSSIKGTRADRLIPKVIGVLLVGIGVLMMF